MKAPANRGETEAQHAKPPPRASSSGAAGSVVRSVIGGAPSAADLIVLALSGGQKSLKSDGFLRNFVSWGYQELKIPQRSPQVPQKLTREYFTTQARGVVKPSWALLELFLVYLGFFKDEISKKIYEILSWYLQYSI